MRGLPSSPRDSLMGGWRNHPFTQLRSKGWFGILTWRRNFQSCRIRNPTTQTEETMEKPRAGFRFFLALAIALVGAFTLIAPTPSSAAMTVWAAAPEQCTS